MKKLQAINIVRTVAVVGLCVLASSQAMASGGGAGGTEFQGVYDQLSGWTSGTLGKTMGVSALLVGLGIGVVKQSVMAATVGVAIALVAGFGPSVIDSIAAAGVQITTMI